jgi:hypothetical protein
VSKVLVQNWLDKLARTATTGNIDAHLELISQHINIVDIEKKKSLDYSDWAEYCRQRFLADQPILVRYRDIRIKTMTPARVKFVATETVEQPDQVDHRGTEFIIQREDDGIWRAVQERLIPLPETTG